MACNISPVPICDSDKANRSLWSSLDLVSLSRALNQQGVIEVSIDPVTKQGKAWKV